MCEKQDAGEPEVWCRLGEWVTTINETQIETLYNGAEDQWQTWISHHGSFKRLIERHESIDDAHKAHQRIAVKHIQERQGRIDCVLEKMKNDKR